MSTILETLGRATAPFADLSVVALQADDAACGHYRIAYPMEMLRRGGAQVHVAAGVDLAALMPYDLIVAQRQYHPQIEALLLEAQAMGKTLVYEIDDNVHAVHPNSVAYNVYRPGSETCHGVKRLIEKSDALFTSSPELASQYGAWNARTWVLPNCIDFGIRDWETPVPRDPRLEGKVVIGWAGSITHQDDWQPLKGAIAPVLARYPEAVFAIVSAHRTMDAFTEGLGLDPTRVVRLEPTGFQEYPALPAQFDIGLAPVINTTFNRAKSDLKPLEYGARGVPYVASAIAPYMRLHRETEGQGGFIARDTREWVAGISRLVEDTTERRAKGEYMQAYVQRERSSSGNAWRWAEALREARDARQYAPQTERRFSVREKPGRNEPCPCGATKPDGGFVKYKVCCTPAFG